MTRQRSATVDLRILDPQSTKAAKQIAVELFDGHVLTLELDHVEQRGPGRYTWHGRVRDQNTGQAILTVVNGHIAGSVTLFDTGARTGVTYQIQSGPNGTSSLRQINPNGFPPDHPPGAENLRAAAPSTGGSSADTGRLTTNSTADTTTTTADGVTPIDVMVVYSNQTATAAGTGIGAQIQQAVDKANAAYANSGIAIQLRLVHFEPANYSESGDFDTDLNRLTTSGDGYMDGVQALRDTYGADMVSLFIENAQYCGIAWIGPQANYAFSVVNRGCASGNLTFAHELGHNFGARHDPYVDASTSPYRYGHGHVNPAQGWRTVMAYNNACVAAGTSCTRIPYFSNPNLTYGANPLGTVSTSDNARVHNGNAITVAHFRTVAAGGCTYALSPTGTSIGAAGASGSFSVTAGSGCAWNSVSNASWLTIDPGSGTSDSGTLNYSATANAGSARSGAITVGDRAFNVSQASGCTYTLNPTSASVGEGGGNGSFTLTAGAGCAWSTGSSASWLTVTSATSGTGNATVNWSAAANIGAQRSGNLSVGGATFVVTESAATTPISAPIATLSSSALSFGNLKIGTTSAAKRVALTNSGGGTLTIASMTSGGTHPGDFAHAGTCAVNTTLTAGQSCSLQYTFTPSGKGSRSATLAVGTSAATVNLSLSGRGK